MSAIRWSSLVLAIGALIYAVSINFWGMVPLWSGLITFWIVRIVQTRKRHDA